MSRAPRGRAARLIPRPHAPIPAPRAPAQRMESLGNAKAQELYGEVGRARVAEEASADVVEAHVRDKYAKIKQAPGPVPGASGKLYRCTDRSTGAADAAAQAPASVAIASASAAPAGAKSTNATRVKKKASASKSSKSKRPSSSASATVRSKVCAARAHVTSTHPLRR